MLGVRPPAHRNGVPADRDVGVVVRVLGCVSEPVYEGDCLAKIAKAVAALQRAAHLVPALGIAHARAFSPTVSFPSATTPKSCVRSDQATPLARWRPSTSSSLRPSTRSETPGHWGGYDSAIASQKRTSPPRA